jgi:hypothetical protein
VLARFIDQRMSNRWQSAAERRQTACIFVQPPRPCSWVRREPHEIAGDTVHAKGVAFEERHYPIEGCQVPAGQLIESLGRGIPQPVAAARRQILRQEGRDEADAEHSALRATMLWGGIVCEVSLACLSASWLV